MRVVVVGAGFAGLAAADALARGGADVVVLEARDRVGGRVWSRELPTGGVVEMGAEFILPDNSAIRETAARLGLRLFDKGTTYGDREPRGGLPVTREELLAAYAAVRDAAANGRLGHGTVVDALASIPMADGARDAIGPGSRSRPRTPRTTRTPTSSTRVAPASAGSRRTPSRAETSGSRWSSPPGWATACTSGARSGGWPARMTAFGWGLAARRSRRTRR